MTETVKALVEALRKRKIGIVAVESCTGGAFASAITDVPGASEILKSSFVTYSDGAKIRLGVSADVIRQHSVYSPETARAMAHAGLNSGSGGPWIGVGITGSLTTVDRPDPANPGNPVPGKVWAHIATWFAGTDARFLSKDLVIDAVGADRAAEKKSVVEAVAASVLDLVLTKLPPENCVECPFAVPQGTPGRTTCGHAGYVGTPVGVNGPGNTTIWTHCAPTIIVGPGGFGRDSECPLLKAGT